MALDVYAEMEYVGRMHLRNLSRFGRGWNFSCPLCDEGSHKNRKRAYVLAPKGSVDRVIFVCHNCFPDGMTLRSFIRINDPLLFEEYRAQEKKQFIEDLKSGKATFRKRQEYTFTPPEKELQFFKLNPRTFIPASDFLPAVKYAIQERKLPVSVVKELMYCPKKEINGKRNPFYDMLIFPFYAEEPREDLFDTMVHGFQGRSIRGEKRFHTFSKNESFKVYNFFRVDKSKPVYIFEAIIDSLGIPNSMSMLGADMSDRIMKQIPEKIFVFDNDTTGLKKSLKYAEEGHNVLVWPKEIQAKDFNKLVTKGITHNQLMRMIDGNIYNGLQAVTRLKMRIATTKK